MDDRLEQIEKYVLGQLDEKERALFEVEIVQDDFLRKEVQKFRLIHEAAELAVEDDLRDQLEIHAGRNGRSGSRRTNISPIWGLAATLLIILGISLWWNSIAPDTSIGDFAKTEYIQYNASGLRGEGQEQLTTGLQYIESGEMMEAALWFANYAKNNPEDVEVKFILADLWYQAENWREARKSYRQIIDENGIPWKEKATWNYICVAALHDWDTYAEEQLEALQSDLNHSYHTLAVTLANMME